MKKAFTIYVDDDCHVRGLQIAAAVERNDYTELGVTFFTIDERADNEAYLFKPTGAAEKLDGGDAE